MRLLSGAALLALLGPALLAAAPALADGHDHDHAEDSAHEHCVVTIENTGEAALSPGVWLVHHDRDALWGPGLAADARIELLAETGANTTALTIAEDDHRAMAIPAIPPGNSVSFEFENEPEGAFLSTINKLMDSNDSFVGIANERLFSERGEPVLEEWELLAFDAGTEENEPRGGGFEAGQPDVTRGLANVDNGQPTEGGMITENNPQYDNTPQALLTVRCETVDVSHAEAVAIREAGGDPYAADADAADTGAHAAGAEHEHCEGTITYLGGAVLSQGVALVHHDRDALWGPGLSADASIELLAETGNPGDPSERAGAAYALPTLLPGASAHFSFDNDAGDGVYLSTINKLMDSNDSFVGVANVRLLTDRDEPVLETFDLLAWDAGTEENEPLGGGFEAGQPDVARGADNVDNGTPTEGGVITENNPQYGNQPQARLTLRCEAVAMSHADAAALTNAGGDPFAAGDEGADMPSDPDAETPDEPSDADDHAHEDGETDAMPSEPQQDGDADMPAESSDADDGETDAMPSEPQQDGDAEMPAEPSDADDGEMDAMPSEPQQDGDAEMPAEPSDADDGETDAMPSEDDDATAPRVGTGLAPDGDGGQTLAILLALAAAVATLGGATLAVRKVRR